MRKIKMYIKKSEVIIRDVIPQNPLGLGTIAKLTSTQPLYYSNEYYHKAFVRLLFS